MKAEKFARLILENCLTKKGDIFRTDYDMLYHLCFFSPFKKHTVKWIRANGYLYSKNSYDKDTNLLKKLGIDFEILNDAPRGGKNGNCIIITPNSRRRIKPFIDAINEYCNKKYNIKVESKMGEIYRVSNFYNITYNTLLDAIKKIAK